MSIAAYNYAWMVAPELTGGQFRVLFALADCHNARTGRCCPSERTIAKRTGLARSNVQRAIWSLVDAGIIACMEHRPGRPTRYRFPIGAYVEGTADYPQVDAPTRPPAADRVDAPTRPSGRAHASTVDAPTRPESERIGIESCDVNPKPDAAAMREVAERARREERAARYAARHGDPPVRVRGVDAIARKQAIRDRAAGLADSPLTRDGIAAPASGSGERFAAVASDVTGDEVRRVEPGAAGG